MCGSSPLPEAVTRSTGTGALLPGSAARSASTRPWTALTRSGLVGLRLDPEDEAALYGNGLVAEGRPQKYLGSSKGWPMRAEPTSLPSLETRLPWAWYGKTAWATPVTRSGYATPVTRVRATRMTRAGRSCTRMMSTPPLHEAEGHEDHVHELDPRERDEDPAHPVDPEVAPEDGRRADGTVAHTAEGERDEGDAERRERPARHQHLLARLHHLQELGGIGVEVDHVARFLGRLRARVHGHRHVGLGESGRVVGAVAGHGHQPSFRLQVADQLELHLRCRLSEEVIHAGFGTDGGGGERVVARDHDGLDAHAAKLGEPVADAAFHDVFELDHPEHLGTVRHDKWGAARLGDGIHDRSHAREHAAPQPLDVGLDGLGGALADLAPAQIHPAHPRLRAELHELRPHGLHVALAQAVLLLGQHYDTPSLRGFVGQRGELGGVGERGLAHAVAGIERGGLPIAEGDGARLV